ncbi:MAG TPA: hypothetical protein VMM78_17475 [Thermomicrobiales bacterium]|nr:hypothetical protein [Thermomicrobiales bacterium]
MTARVLIVDDDAFFVRRARAALEGSFELQIVSNRDAALAAIETWAPDIVVLDATLGGSGAFGLLDEMRTSCLDGVPRVLFVAKGPGSIHRLQVDGSSFLGVILRESGMDGLLAAVRCALGTVMSRRLLTA